VTKSTLEEFISLTIQARANEAEQQFQWVKEGFENTVKLSCFNVLTAVDLELRCKGYDDVNIELFKGHTHHEDHCGGEDFERLKGWFWKMMEEFTPEQRCQYLKFVWGRARLPSNLKGAQKHYLYVGNIRNKEAFPIGHTCGFSLEFPRYEDYDLMKQRFTFAIETCAEIDGD
jgi:hypothetical protein